jgi:hypothetical protein
LTDEAPQASLEVISLGCGVSQINGVPAVVSDQHVVTDAFAICLSIKVERAMGFFITLAEEGTHGQDANHDDHVTRQNPSVTVLNSTVTSDTNSYSRCMSPEPIHEPVVDQGFEDRWAAWQARGDANDRATKRKLLIMAAILTLSVAILSVLSLLR